VRLISTTIYFSILLTLTACGGGDGTYDSQNSTKQRLAGAPTVISSSSDIPDNPSMPDRQPIKSIAVTDSLMAPDVAATNATSDTKQRTKMGAAQLQIPEGYVESSSYSPTGPIVARSVYSQGSFSPYTQPAWITDEGFWPSYRLILNIGNGYSTVPPSGAGTPAAPNPSNVGGYAAYLIPAKMKSMPIPYAPTWNDQPLNAPWYNFLTTSMACAPACTMVIADILPGAARPTSMLSLGARPGSPQLSLGSPELDGHYLYPVGGPRVSSDVISIAIALDRKAERLQKAWVQLETLLGYAVGTGPNEYQYALMAKADGKYPDVRYGWVQMKTGDVWKFGTSMDPDSRYSQAYLDGIGVSMVIQYTGTRIETLVREKMNLINYYISHGELPPGNKIFK
jgi:hypothetical protein